MAKLLPGCQIKNCALLCARFKRTGSNRCPLLHVRGMHTSIYVDSQFTPKNEDVRVETPGWVKYRENISAKKY